MKCFFMLLSALTFTICHADSIDIQLRTSYFLPQDSTLRKVYKDGWEGVQIKASYQNFWEVAPWINYT